MHGNRRYVKLENERPPTVGSRREAPGARGRLLPPALARACSRRDRAGIAGATIRSSPSEPTACRASRSRRRTARSFSPRALRTAPGPSNACQAPPAPRSSSGSSSALPEPSSCSRRATAAADPRRAAAAGLAGANGRDRPAERLARLRRPRAQPRADARRRLRIPPADPEVVPPPRPRGRLRPPDRRGRDAQGLPAEHRAADVTPRRAAERRGPDRRGLLGRDDRVVANEETQGLDRAIPLRELARRARRRRARVRGPAGGVLERLDGALPDVRREPRRPHTEPNGQHTTILDRHAFLVALAARPPPGRRSRPTTTSTSRAHAPSMPASCSTRRATRSSSPGNLEGYAIDAAGARHYLLLDAAGVEWYRSPTPPTARVELSAAVSGAPLRSPARVTGASGGSVEIWRETQAGARAPHHPPTRRRRHVCAHDTPPARPLTYRAVYRDANGLPLSSLVRSVLGA